MLLLPLTWIITICFLTGHSLQCILNTNARISPFTSHHSSAPNSFLKKRKSQSPNIPNQAPRYSLTYLLFFSLLHQPHCSSFSQPGTSSGSLYLFSLTTMLSSQFQVSDQMEPPSLSTLYPILALLLPFSLTYFPPNTYHNNT